MNGKLDARIVAALVRSPLSTPELSKEVGADPQLVEQRCRALKRAGRLLHLDPLDDQILTILRAGKAPVSTTDLTEKIVGEAKMSNKERARVYRHCVRLAKKGRLISFEKVDSPRLFFYNPKTHRVLNRGNFADVHGPVVPFHPKADVWSLVAWTRNWLQKVGGGANPSMPNWAPIAAAA